MMNIELQHVNVKLFLRNAEGLMTGDYTGVFNDWIQTRALGELKRRYDPSADSDGEPG